MKVDMLHPNTDINNFEVLNGRRHTQWDSVILKDGKGIIGARGSICEFGWFDFLLFTVSDISKTQKSKAILKVSDKIRQRDEEQDMQKGIERKK